MRLSEANHRRLEPKTKGGMSFKNERECVMSTRVASGMANPQVSRKPDRLDNPSTSGPGNAIDAHRSGIMSSTSTQAPGTARP